MKILLHWKKHEITQISDLEGEKVYNNIQDIHSYANTKKLFTCSNYF